MDKARTHQQLFTNWVTIVIGAVFLIQGLVLSELMTRLRPVYDNFNGSIDGFNVVVHTFLCLVLALRFIQTYVIAAVDYNPWKPSLFDVLLIFIAGAVEYVLFLTIVPNFDAAIFHRRLIIIAFIAIFGYLGALYRLDEDLFPNRRDYIREVRLQVVNIAGLVVGLITSFIIITQPNLAHGGQMLLVSIASVALILNMYHSIRITFPKGDYMLQVVHALQSDSGPSKKSRHSHNNSRSV